MKRGSIPPTFVFPVIAIGLLVLAFLYYYFPARIDREDALNRQAFRQLGTVADLMQNAISNYGTALQRWTKGGNMEGFTDQVPDLRFAGKPLDKPLGESTSGACKLNSTSGSDQVLLRFQCGAYGADIPVEVLVQRFIQGDPEETFDEFLVADKSGAVLYQTRRTGLHLGSLSGLLAPGADKKPDANAAAAKQAGSAQLASDVVKVSLGGTDYRLYSSPAPIRLQSSVAEPALDLVIYGLISEANVRTRALETPGTVQLTVGLVGAVLIFIAWPLLKFRTMRASERVPRRAAMYFFISSIVTIALLFVLCIHLGYALSDFDISSRVPGVDRTSDELQRLAEAIDTNVTVEAAQAVDALGQAMTSDPFLAAARNVEEHKAECGQDETYSIKGPKGNMLAWRDFPVAGYPYFDQMFWVDKNGFQQIKWTVRTRPTPATRLCQFKFFLETMQGHLWQFADGNRKPGFRIDPLYSPNTGEYQAVISLSYDHAADPPGLPPRPLAMTAMVTQMLSLINPVVPPGYGFAMVDESGGVLFHSLPERNGREQLFDEVNGDPAVRAAVFARTGGHLVTSYHGAPHRFFVRPLRHIMGCPWTLVTFRDLRPLAAVQLQRTTLLLVLSVAYLLLVCCFAVIFIPMQDYPRTWLWPQPKMNGRYIYTTLSLLALAAIMYAVVIWASLLVSFVASISASIAAIVILNWMLQGRELHPRVLTLLLAASIAMTFWRILWIQDLSWWRVGPLLVAACLVLRSCSSPRIIEWITDWIATHRLPDFSISYTAMSLSILLLVPTLPCVCFFRIAYDYQENMFARHAQLETMSALEDRVERVLRAYTQVNLTDNTGRVNDVARAMFLRGRLDDVRLDRYDTVFVAGTGQEYSPDPRNTAHARREGSATEEPESRFWPPLQVLASLWGDPSASDARFLNQPDRQSTRWKWTLAGDRHLRMTPQFVRPNQNSTTASPQTAALARLAANNPDLLSEDLISELQPLKPGFWESVTPVVVVGAFMFVLFRSTVTRIYLLHIKFDGLWPMATLDEAIASRCNLILVGPPGVRRSLSLEDSVTRTPAVYLIDLVETVPEWLAAQSKGLPAPHKEVADPVVVLDHFEYNCQDAEVNRIKLEILESLLKLDKQLLIVGDIDPKFYLATGPLDDAGSPEGFAPGKYCDRWIAALDAFDLRTLARANGSNGHHFERLWAVCSRSERVALYLLAMDGWPNHKNWRALNHLVSRGLVERTPVIRIANPGFREFIRNVVGQTDVASVWERGESITIWDGLKVALYVLSVGALVAVSVYHQQQVLALITTLLGVLPGLGKLFHDGLGAAGKAGKGGDSA